MKQISWDEAEDLFPGCKAEWAEMCSRPGDCRPFSWIVGFPEGACWTEFQPSTDGEILFVKLIDREGKWLYPPEWRRWGDKEWTHPMPLPKMTLVFEDLEVKR